MRRGAEVEEAIMLKRIALLGAMAALTIVKPSNAVAQGWDGWGGITVNVGFPFPHRRRDFCCEERRFFPRRVFEERRDFCCEENRFFPRRVFEERRDFCCEENRFFPRRVFEERRDFCCEESRFFPRRFGRPPYYYGDRFAPYAYNWNGGYTNAGYRYNEY
jgi:hypothetical protein